MQSSGRLEALLKRMSTGGDPAAQLRALSELRGVLDNVESELAADAIRAGLSWREVGAAIGVSKQAAHRRHRESVASALASGEGPSRAAAAAGANVSVSVTVRRAVRIARLEAAALGAGEVGTEHLLLGVLQCGDERAGVLLTGAGVTLEAARDAIDHTRDLAIDMDRRGPSGEGPSGAAAVVSPAARRMLAHALRQAAARESNELTALDLLRGLVTHDETGAVRTLERMHVDPRSLRSSLLRLQEPSLLRRS